MTRDTRLSLSRDLEPAKALVPYISERLTSFRFCIWHGHLPKDTRSSFLFLTSLLFTYTRSLPNFSFFPFDAPACYGLTWYIFLFLDL